MFWTQQCQNFAGHEERSKHSAPEQLANLEASKNEASPFLQKNPILIFALKHYPRMMTKNKKIRMQQCKHRSPQMHTSMK
jgi:hypothetical protein